MLSQPESSMHKVISSHMLSHTIGARVMRSIARSCHEVYTSTRYKKQRSDQNQLQEQGRDDEHPYCSLQDKLMAAMGLAVAEAIVYSS
mmetsp:Transcript_60295/g.135806  ORF Transcript_60295/g.135806 Transcript_60295/m.135806 type:complete len:88 (-) Transcript_60295:12-275(-)